MSVSKYLKGLGFRGFKSGCGGCGGGGKTTYEKWVFGRLLRVKSSDWTDWTKTSFNYKLMNKKFRTKEEFDEWYRSITKK